MAVSDSVLSLGSPPIPRTRLIGREKERRTARSLLLDEAVPLLTMTGPGGVGKTRLALAVAGDVADHFADGVIWVDLAPLADPALVPETVANALGVARVSSSAVEDQLALYLQSRQTLLLLDNCEHLLASVADVIAPLLASCPALQILGTSRAPLRIRGEYALSVDPLPVPRSGDQASSADVAGNPSVQLFMERARAAHAAAVEDDVSLDTVAEICRRVDGLPLAIELAAARVRVLPLAALRDRLQHRLPLLGGGARDAPPRQRTVRDTIGWSYGLLTPEQQALFRRLAVFVGGFTLDAVEAVLESIGNLRVDSVEGIAALRDSSLLRLEPGRGGEPRYRMLETVREYGLEQLEASDEGKTARDAHAAFYLDLADRAAPVLLGGNPVAWLHRLADDHDNLRATFDWLCAGDTPQECLRLAGACGWYWFRRGHIHEGRARLEHALARAELEPTVAKGRAVRWAAELAIRDGDLTTAASFAQEAFSICDAVGDPLGRTLAVHVNALVKFRQGQWDVAARLFREELGFWRAIGDARAIGMALLLLGGVAYRQGELRQARTLVVEGADQFREVADDTWLAATESNLALFDAAEGRFAEAAGHYRASLHGYAEAGDAFLQVPLAGLATMAIECGHLETAAKLLGAADMQIQRTGTALDQLERHIHDQAQSRAARALGKTEFAAAHAEGRNLTPDDWFAEADAIVSALQGAESTSRERDDRFAAGLTRREREILLLLAEGLSDREMAARLFISQGTVRSHMTSIFGKLEVGSRTAAVAAARHLGML